MNTMHQIKLSSSKNVVDAISTVLSEMSDITVS
jgi:hypothetical protein